MRGLLTCVYAVCLRARAGGFAARVLQLTGFYREYFEWEAPPDPRLVRD